MHLSNLKVINFHSAFKLAVHSSAVVSFLDLPENLCELLMDLLLSFLSMLHVPCWCLHVFVILLVQYITSNVPQIFSVCNILQQYVCFHALFLTDLHFFFLIFLFSPYKYNLNFWCCRAICIHMKQHTSLWTEIHAAVILLPILL